ncbi:hypothetical protein ASPCADRAFT_211651 [Aspergillus carbonarius ITEM 5010]|uniref:SPRY domain-containing protein n=1 Tax=Aspergillus carbonarius (strain ITEM 5010) TaxID=602072 RepID=A0A1R3R9A0_ASPC5|nr:hypothetical protein ASPCADRAFT_211651 [Aspergillus carbonarius ITEM 5010]
MATRHGSPAPLHHNWQEIVPDTATFLAPPVVGLFRSNAGNASWGDADRNKFPLQLPVKPSNVVYSAVRRYDLKPSQSPEFRGYISVVGQGCWRGSTDDGNGDCLLTTNLPLYFSMEDSPILRTASKTIYFEVKLLGIGVGLTTQSTDDSGFSIGFVAQPYPSWRSPGWERGRLGVFSGDGCCFVNDSWGGKSFTNKLGLGDFDLYGAIGLFGGVDFEVLFDPAAWLWTPRKPF